MYIKEADRNVTTGKMEGVVRGIAARGVKARCAGDYLIYLASFRGFELLLQPIISLVADIFFFIPRYQY